MMRGGRRKRIATLLFAVLIAVLLAAAAALLIAGDVGAESSPALAVAVFGTFLTSMAIIAAFSIEEKSRWPTPWEMLDRAGVSAWFVVGLASVAAALIATGSDSDFLPALSLTLSLIGLLLGARALWGLFSLSSDRGRWKLVVDLLDRSIRDASSSPTGEEADLGEIETEDHVPAWFLSAESAALPHRGGVSIEFVPSVMRSYADRQDSDAMARLVDEVHAAATQALAAGGWPDLDAYLASVDAVLGVQRRIFEELVLRVLSGRLAEATARGALERTGETAIDVAGRARAPAAWPGEDARERIERLVVRHLTALCRLAGAVEGEAAEMKALCTCCSQVQQAARWAIDPDPPGMKVPVDHPWRTGLSDPQSALVWLWSAAEAPSGPFGVGLYALCQILTGRKFFGSYWEGLDIYAEIERRLRDEEEVPPGTHGRAALERAGGLALISLELGAIHLTARPPRVSGGGQRANRLLAAHLFLAGGGYKPAGRDPVADLAWLLTDRLRGSLWTTVHAELLQLPDPVVLPPLRPLYRRPDACALAICLRLVPLERGAEEGLVELRSFVSRLPDRLLVETAELAIRLTVGGEADLGFERSAAETRLVNAARTVRMIVPGALPARQAAPGGEDTAEHDPDAAIDGAPRGWNAKLDPGAEPPGGFAEALRQIAASGSETQVDLIQCDPRWLEEWADLRTQLDAELLAAVLRGRARVRRIVPFGISGEAERRMTKLHYRWTEALSIAVGCFLPQTALEYEVQPPYQVRQVILPFDKADVSPPPDCAIVRAPDARGRVVSEADSRFESLWTRFDPDVRIPVQGLGLIELGGRGAAPAGPLPLLGS
jgi:hypothetical protein